MKRNAALAFVTVLAAAGAAFAQSDSMKGMDMKGMDMDKKASGKKAQGTTHKATGTVQKLDPAAGIVTIAHGPVESMKWPAMTMSFKVKDKALLDKFSPNKKVEFEFVQQGKDYVITSAK
ncbi:MAG TPA: copper-binding protein [Burkholderiales bacterium]|jgi:Cu(I)/Ag(I) efflux system protein CusF|nr:copper-binding protein [Burkholderiales bacterium]